MIYFRISIIALLSLGLLAGAAVAQGVPTDTVRAGDTLYSIAQEHGLTVEALQALNDLEGTGIYPGQVLMVGKAKAGEAEVGRTETGPVQGERKAAVTDTTTAADSIHAQPDTLGVAGGPVSSDTARMMRSRPDTGRTNADVHRRASQAAPDSSRRMRLQALQRGVHVVRPGETLYEIAARYRVSVDTLRALNAPVPTFLSPGAEVRLPKSRTIRTHVVSPGQTLYDLAARYGVSVRALKAINGDLQGDSLAAGTRLRIPGLPEPPAPPGTLAPPDTSGIVHSYPASYAGRLTAGGTRYDPQHFVASHPTLPFGTVVLLTNPAAGRHAFAVITDRGPLDPRFLMDVSAAVARQLSLAAEGEQPVEVRVVRIGKG